MMDADSLKTWDKRWQLIELWTSQEASGVPADPDLSLAIVRVLTHPSQPDDVFAELVARGFFAAAQRWLNDPVVTQLLTANKREHLADELHKAEKIEWAQLQARCGALEVRASRLMVASEALTRRLAECLQLLGVSRDTAERRLIALAAEVDAHGREHERSVRARLTDSHQSGAISDVARRRVERYLDIGELDLAQWILDGRGQSPEETGEIPSVRPLWPFSEPSETVCQWFLGQRSAPLGFAERWGLSPNDSDARHMIEALSTMIAATPPTTESVVTFAAALERFLACQTDGALPTVHQEGQFLFRTIVRGLDASELPALSRVLESSPLQITIALSDTPPDGFEPPAAPAVLFSRARSARWAADFSIDPTLLFRIAASSHRRLDFLREIGAQIPLALALPEEVPLASEERLVTRATLLRTISDGARLVLVTGARGVGKTALLRAVADAFRRADYDVQNVGQLAAHTVLSAGEASKLIEQSLRPAPGTTPVIVVSDLSRQLIANESGTAVLQLIQDLRLLLSLTPHARLVLTVPTPWHRMLEQTSDDTTLIRIEPLTSAETRSIVSKLLDVLGLPPSRSELVDRLVFYSAGWPQLLFGLMREVLSAHAVRTGTHRAALTEEAVEAAWQAPSVTETARELFLRDLDDTPAARLVLGILLQVFEFSEFKPVSVNELYEWWRMYAPAVETELQVIPGIMRLSDAGLLQYNESQSTAVFPQSSVHQLLTRVVVDPDAFCAAAAEALLTKR